SDVPSASLSGPVLQADSRTTISRGLPTESPTTVSRLSSAGSAEVSPTDLANPGPGDSQSTPSGALPVDSLTQSTQITDSQTIKEPPAQDLRGVAGQHEQPMAPSIHRPVILVAAVAVLGIGTAAYWMHGNEGSHRPPAQTTAISHDQTSLDRG